ncbi:hypothetical protein [Coraliomargarita parva]|uniref:hypothetical protein n=1 Tax=Coraliomargarita parva TaxID=3014050 RepID=UPI0022B43873|nr:hypothetical protein [Coraliomargarita parva]
MPSANKFSNNSTRHQLTKSTKGQRSGFALIVALSLTALVVLLLLSITAVARIEVEASSNAKILLKARQNALLGLQIALGQLQKATGPDQRTTATADIIIPAPTSVTRTSTGSEIADNLNTYWKANRNRYWTGSWSNGNTSSFDPENPAAYNPTPSLEGWLVSGYFENPDDFQPTTPVNGVTAASSPGEVFYDASGNAYTILVKNSAGVKSTDDLDRLVTAPVVDIENANSSADGYAWWVGDEGIKARVNLIDPFVDDTTDNGLLRRRSSAQHVAIEAISEKTGEGFDLYPGNDTILSKISTNPQWGDLIDNTSWKNATVEHYHDTTIWSNSVLADMRHGGLKQDLNYILGQSTRQDFANALNAAYGEAIITSLSDTHSVINEKTSPYGELPTSYGSSLLTYSATWEQLWSYYNMGNQNTEIPAGIFNSEGEVIPRPQTEDEQGISPLIIQAKIFYALRIVNGEIFVDSMPMIVLGNPYTVPLAATDYVFEFSDPSPYLRFGEENLTGLSEPLLMKAYKDIFGQSPKRPEKAYVSKFTKMILRSEGIPAGEARIFSIDSSSSVNPDINGSYLEIQPTDNPATTVILTNSYDPNIWLSYNFSSANGLGNKLPTYTYTDSDGAPQSVQMTHVALQLNNRPGISATLRLPDYSNKMVHYIYGHGYSKDKNAFLVNPTSNGTQIGGGLSLYLNDIPTGETSSPLPQQAPFSQVNYRSTIINFYGGSSGSQGHLLEWAWTHVKNGDSAGGGNLNPYLQSNLMFSNDGDSDFEKVRWGSVNVGAGNYEHTAPESIGGESSQTGFVNLLYDTPSPDQVLNSIGQLQHFNTVGYIPSGTSWSSSSILAHMWQVNYPIANSYPHPRISREKVFDNLGSGYGTHYDGSYIWNDILSDRFFFSSYPTTGDFDFETDHLVNSRYRPFREEDEVAWDDTEAYRGDENSSTASNSRMAATNLMLEGGFNVNSTSTNAWKSILSSLREVSVGGETSLGNLTAPFARSLNQTGMATDADKGNTANSWNGIRNLTDSEINELAEEIALQVRLRGPFLSFADFVNRKLISKNEDTYGLALGGTLQVSTDKAVNKLTNLDKAYQTTAIDFVSGVNSAKMAEKEYVMPASIAGFPGHLLQADMLTILSPSLTARSDTFTIRAYGESRNPVTQETEGRAWCEAVVQRLPDYVVQNDGSKGNEAYEDPTDRTNATFGRRYTILSFRWLNSEEI